MVFCREFHMTYLEYLEQPADVMVKWRQYVRVEREAEETVRKIEEFRAKHARKN